MPRNVQRVGANENPQRKTPQSITAQQTGQRRRTFDSFERNLLALANGCSEEAQSILSEWMFRTRKGKKMTSNILDQHYNQRLDTVMQNINQLRLHCPRIQRNVILSCVSTVFTRKELNDRWGMQVGESSYTKARRIARTAVGRPITKRQVNSNTLSDTTVEVIRGFFYDASRQAMNRTIKVGPPGQKITAPVRYLHEPLQETFIQFGNKYPEYKVSFSSFRKYKPPQIKKPHRDTDMCPYCEQRKETIIQLEACNNEEEKARLTEDLRLFNNHRTQKATIREAYKKHKEEMKVGEAIIVMDFKENMCLGRGNSESSRDFYDTPQRSVFTIAVYTREGASNNVKEDRRVNYFTFVSTVLNHDTRFVFDCWRMLLQDDEWKSLNIQPGCDVNIWLDNAPQHFRTYRFLWEYRSMAMTSFAQNNLKLNYFSEYHGKCVCDSHFSLLSRYYSDYTTSRQYGTPVYETEPFIALLRAAVDRSNATKAALNEKRRDSTAPLKLARVKFFNYVRDEEELEFTQLTARNFTIYYHFFFSDNNYNKLMALECCSSEEVPFEFQIKTTTATTTATNREGWSGSQRQAAVSTDELLRKERGRAENRARASNQRARPQTPTARLTPRSRGTQTTRQQPCRTRRATTPRASVPGVPDAFVFDFSFAAEGSPRGPPPARIQPRPLDPLIAEMQRSPSLSPSSPFCDRSLPLRTHFFHMNRFVQSPMPRAVAPTVPPRTPQLFFAYNPFQMSPSAPRPPPRG